MNAKNQIAEKLEKLIRLFERLKKKIDKDSDPGTEHIFKENLNSIQQSYNMIKSEVSDDMLDNMGEPFDALLRDMVNQLEEELMTVTVSGNLNENEEEIKEIDEMLSDSSLSSDEIDDLLDMRSELTN